MTDPIFMSLLARNIHHTVVLNLFATACLTFIITADVLPSLPKTVLRIVDLNRYKPQNLRKEIAPAEFSGL